MTTSAMSWYQNAGNFTKMVYAALSDNAELKREVRGVFTSVPAKTPYPYIHIDEVVCDQSWLQGLCVSQYTCKIFVYDDGSSSARCARIVALLQETLRGFIPAQGIGEGSPVEGLAAGVAGYVSGPHVGSLALSFHQGSGEECFWVGEVDMAIQAYGRPGVEVAEAI